MQNTLREFRGRVTIGNADIIYNNRFARCENIVWILFKSMLGSSFPPPLILVLHEKQPFLYRDWKQCARAVCYPLSCFSLSSFAGCLRLTKVPGRSLQSEPM